MREKLGYRLPFVLMLVVGIFSAIQYYVPHPLVQTPKELMFQWKQPLNGFIIFVALGGLAVMHVRRVFRRERRWGYSAITLLSMAAMVVVGMVWGIQDGGLFSTWFKHLITPIESTMFALLAFFIASAAFRAFRARTTGATILLLSAGVVMLGLIPAVEDAVPPLAKLAKFLLDYPNTAAKRAIMIGVGLGAISVALKTILGIDRTLLDRER
ncbi:MAG: hypothetical protein JRF63_13700 [Deltaproteobacteria bacterium]|nr:hypothetical protein [Deltaproteobacteria bacterium]